MNENRNSLHHNNTFENKSMLEKILLYQGKFKYLNKRISIHLERAVSKTIMLFILLDI